MPHRPDRACVAHGNLTAAQPSNRNHDRTRIRALLENERGRSRTGSFGQTDPADAVLMSLAVRLADATPLRRACTIFCRASATTPAACTHASHTSGDCPSGLMCADAYAYGILDTQTNRDVCEEARGYFATFNTAGVPASVDSGRRPATFAISKVCSGETPTRRAAISIMLTMLF